MCAKLRRKIVLKTKEATFFLFTMPLQIHINVKIKANTLLIQLLQRVCFIRKLYGNIVIIMTNWVALHILAVNYWISYNECEIRLVISNMYEYNTIIAGQVAQAARRLATEWTAWVRSRVSEGWRFFFTRSCPDWSWGPSASYKNECRG